MADITLDQSLANIQGQLQTMFGKIQTEGITDKSGNVLLSAGSLKDVSGLNITPTAVPTDTANSLETLKTQATTALASATSQDEFLKAQQELFKQQQEELAKNQAEQKSWIDKAKELIGGRKKSVDILKAEQEKLGVPAMWSNVQALIPEIGALNTQLAQLQTAEMTEVSGIQQNPQYSVQFASREAQRVSRDYAIKQAGLSAELGAKTALMNAYQGNITAANNMVGDIVNAMNYDTTQKLTDINTFMDNNQTFISGLEKGQKDILDNIQKYWDTKSKNDSEDYKFKLNMIIDAAKKGVNLGIEVNDAKKMSLEDIASLYQSKVSGAVAAKEGVKPIGVLDAGRYNDLYPGANVLPSDTQTQADIKVRGLITPRNYTDEELRTLVNADKTNKKSYQEVINSLNTITTIANKDRAKLIIDEIYGKKPAGTPRTSLIEKTIEIGTPKGTTTPIISGGNEPGYKALTSWLQGAWAKVQKAKTYKIGGNK